MVIVMTETNEDEMDVFDDLDEFDATGTEEEFDFDFEFDLEEEPDAEAQTEAEAEAAAEPGPDLDLEGEMGTDETEAIDDRFDTDLDETESELVDEAFEEEALAAEDLEAEADTAAVEEVAEPEPELEPRSKRKAKKKRAGKGKKLGVGLIVAGLVVLAFIPVWTYAILPGQMKLPDTKSTYEDEFDYEGELSLLNTTTMQPVVYPNAKGIKYQQLNRSDDTYLYLYGNVTVYDENGEFVTILTHSTPTVNRENYKEKYEGDERPRWFPIGTEKKEYEFGNPFVSSHLNTYAFEAEETRDGLDCYRFHSLEPEIDYGTKNGMETTMRYEEHVWIHPPTGSTMDQTYNVTVFLHIPDTILDLPTDYESYTNYTGSYTVLDSATFRTETTNARGVMHIATTNVDGNRLDLEGDLRLYNADNGSFIETMAEIEQSIDRHTHNMIVNGTEVVIDYSTAGYEAANPLIDGYTNEYDYIETVTVGGREAYHFRATELDIPYDAMMPEGLPPGTHLFLNYIEDIWIDTATHLTLDQAFNITAMLHFSEALLDIPDDYESYTNYTGTYTALNMSTFVPSTINATGVLHIAAVGVEGLNLTVAGDLSLYHAESGLFIETMAEINRTLNKRTHNEIVNGTEVEIAYEEADYTADNALLPGYTNTYRFIGVETVSGIDAYHYRATELGIPYDAGLPTDVALPPDTHLFLHYIEDVWVEPATETTLDQHYNITAMLEFSPALLDIPDDYESYTNYTGTYTTLNMTTFMPETINASGLLHLAAVDTDGLNITVAGNLSLYSADSGDMIRVMAEIERTLNKRTHNLIENGTEIEIPYEEADYTAANALIPGYTNSYTYLGVENVTGIQAYHYRATELGIPYDAGIPADATLPAGTHMVLNYIEDVWVEPATKTTMDQHYNITAILHFSETMMDLPVDYTSYTNYTGSFMVLDTDTMQPMEFSAVDGVLEVVSEGFYNDSMPGVLDLNVNLTVYNDSMPVYTLIDDDQKLVHNHTHRYYAPNGSMLPPVVYDTEDYLTANPFVPDQMTHYHYIGTEVHEGLSCYVYEANATLPYDEGLPATAPDGATMWLDYYEKQWVEPESQQLIDQILNVSSTIQFPNLEAFPLPSQYDPQDQMFDEESGGLLYIFGGNTTTFAIEQMASGGGMNATYLGPTPQGAYRYNVSIFYPDGTGQTYALEIDPYTAEILNFDLGGEHARFTFPVGVPDPAMDYPMWDADLNMSFNASYIGDELYHGVPCMKYRYHIDNVSYSNDRTFGQTLGPLLYNGSVTYYVDSYSGVVIDIHRTITKYAPGASFNITGTPLPNEHAFFHIAMNYTPMVIDGRINDLVGQLRESVALSEQNMTAMRIDARYDDDTVARQLAFVPEVITGQTIAAMGYEATAEVIHAAYDAQTMAVAAGTVEAMQTALAIQAMNFSAPAKIIRAQFDSQTKAVAAGTVEAMQTGLAIKAMNFRAPAKIIIAEYDDATQAGAVASATQLEGGMAIAGKQVPAMTIEADYTDKEVEEGADAARELESTLTFGKVTMPMIIAIIGIAVIAVGAIVIVRARKGKSG